VKEQIKAFIDMVEQENGLLDSLAEMGEQKRQLIILGEVKELDKLIRKESLVLTNLDKQEGARFKLQQDISAAWGLKPAEMAAARLLKAVAEKYPELYPNMQAAINRLDYNLARLQAINAHNHELLEQSLDFISMVESMVNGDVAGVYSHQGLSVDERPGRVKNNLLDKKV